LRTYTNEDLIHLVKTCTNEKASDDDSFSGTLQIDQEEDDCENTIYEAPPDLKSQ